MDFNNKRILVVDDEPGILAVLRDIYMTGLGVEVTIASNGLEAFQHLEKDEFDLLCTDLKMPVMDGGALVKAVRESHGPNKDIPILVVTGYAEDISKIVEGREKILILDKPIDEKRLINSAKLFLKT